MRGREKETGGERDREMGGRGRGRYDGEREMGGERGRWEGDRY